MNRHRNEHQRGAAAVEFALVVPILLVLVMGTIEFGYLLFLQGSAAGAAREGAREMAIHRVQADAVTAALDAFPAGAATASVPATCDPGSSVEVTVTYTYSALTGFFGSSFTAEGSGVMRCGG